MIVRGTTRVLAAAQSTITMTVSGDRPGYLAQTLDSWARVRGLQGGVHALPEEFEETPAATFLPHRGPVSWRGATAPGGLTATVGG